MESIPLLLRKNTQDYLSMERPSTSIAPENSNRILFSPTDRTTINLENQQIKDDFTTEGISDLRELRWLYRFFPLWIFLAVVVGLIFGILVPNTGTALGKGRFLGVPAPSGWLHQTSHLLIYNHVLIQDSNRVDDYHISGLM